jgi:prepilin signal peptidase PulO-like enzyme (type II secretory pathway)
MAVYAAATAAGALAGLWMRMIAVSAIRKREETPTASPLVFSVYARVLWPVIGSAASLLTTLAFGPGLRAIEILYAAAVLLVISAVDHCIQRIPNEAILALIIGAIALMLIRGSASSVADHLWGAGLCTLVFLLPVLMGQSAGAGDIKLAAAMGFYVGLGHAFAAMFAMSVLFILRAAYLLVTKRGNLKTLVAMGPMMSLGFISSLTLFWA